VFVNVVKHNLYLLGSGEHLHNLLLVQVSYVLHHSVGDEHHMARGHWLQIDKPEYVLFNQEYLFVPQLVRAEP